LFFNVLIIYATNIHELVIMCNTFINKKNKLFAVIIYLSKCMVCSYCFH